MARKLTLKIDRLAELTADDLAVVAGAQDTKNVFSVIICITDMLTVCDAARCAA